ncbi:MAG: bifunctional demethylmenaquinone methyltransferase/2-methoxy-6-polyprenyl-1,4-benzoquinol methylase UbiE [Deltaproteobacteria bacterium]|nr:bifunctional demethylmenaquinone methyltransferase/2-methoxy-6-polyprenyl-1,4-benzoquinol methylase UbiE [Deltaproteobacteria bacterium]
MDKEKTFYGRELIPKEEKKPRIKDLFTSVAGQYDLMNDLMSFGIHRLWKRSVARATGLKKGERAIDVAGGTADIAMLLKDRVGEDGSVVVYDLNIEMLEIGREKCIDKGLLKNITYIQGDAENISFEDNTFHSATIGFGIRNVTDLKKAFTEMTRIVKPGGRVVCLEFSHVKSQTLSLLYDIYSFKVIPAVGEAITGNKGAYEYLTESIRKFPPQDELQSIMKSSGLFRVRYQNLFGGVAAIHTGIKA